MIIATKNGIYQVKDHIANTYGGGENFMGVKSGIRTEHIYLCTMLLPHYCSSNHGVIKWYIQLRCDTKRYKAEKIEKLDVEYFFPDVQTALANFNYENKAEHTNSLLRIIHENELK